MNQNTPRMKSKRWPDVRPDVLRRSRRDRILMHCLRDMNFDAGNVEDMREFSHVCEMRKYDQEVLDVGEEAIGRIPTRYDFGVCLLGIAGDKDENRGLVSMMAVLTSVCEKYPLVKMLVGVELTGEAPVYTQKFPFIITTPMQAICFLRRDLPPQITSFADILIGCDIAADEYQIDVVYGVLFALDQPTIFVRSDCDVHELDEATGIAQIAGKLNAILAQG